MVSPLFGEKQIRAELTCIGLGMTGREIVPVDDVQGHGSADVFLEGRKRSARVYVRGSATSVTGAGASTAFAIARFSASMPSPVTLEIL